MLNFPEVARRMGMRTCDCGHCNPDEVGHSFIVSPIVEQLSGDYCASPVLLTPHECHAIANLIGGQAAMLDEKDEALHEAQQVVTTLDEALDVMSGALSTRVALLRRQLWGIGISVVWLASIVVSVWLAS